MSKCFADGEPCQFYGLCEGEKCVEVAEIS